MVDQIHCAKGNTHSRLVSYLSQGKHIYMFGMMFVFRFKYFFTSVLFTHSETDIYTHAHTH